MSRARFERGDFPDVCAKTGERAQEWLSVRVEDLPYWVWSLLLFGGFPFLIARRYTVRRVEGVAPISAALGASLKRRRQVVAGCLLGVVGLLVVSGTLVSVVPALAALGLAVATLGLYIATVVQHNVGSRLNEDGRVVVLKRLHPRFVEALHADTPAHSGG